MDPSVMPPSVMSWLQLAPGAAPQRFDLPIRHELCTPFETLYGGSVIAACIEAAERTALRPVVWATTQFIGSPRPGDHAVLDVELLATGKATTQSRVDGRVDGRLVFTSLAGHTTRGTDDDAAFGAMPDVPGPDECPAFPNPFETDARATFFDALDRRLAAGPQGDTLAFWTRIVGQPIGSAATQAFISDVVPLAIAARLGILPGGTSLDNTLRVVDSRPSEWVLLELIADGFHRSIGHGTIRMWSQDGRLLGIHQQSAIIRTSHHRRAASDVTGP